MDLYYFVAAIAVLLLLLLTVLVARRHRSGPALHLSDNERTFAQVLEKVVGGQYRVQSKVAMSELFEADPDSKPREARKSLKRLQHRGFDYVVFNQRGEVVCAVELDDHQYSRKHYRKTDLFTDELCYATSLPLLRVPAQKGYNLVELIERFEQTVSAKVPAELPVYTQKTAIRLKIIPH